MAMLAGAAYSQINEERAKDPWLSKLDQEQKAREDAEKGYNATMKRLKSQAPTTVQNDPWRSVRPAAKTDAKTDAKSETKTEAKR